MIVSVPEFAAKRRQRASPIVNMNLLLLPGKLPGSHRGSYWEVTGEVTGKSGRLLTVLSRRDEGTEIQENLRSSMRTIRVLSLPALKAALIEMTVPDKPAAVPALRITESGRKALKTLRGKSNGG